MSGRNFIKLKKEEYGIKEYIKRDLGKGKISRLDIEYTPVGEKIIVSTSRPGLVIGRRGEKINELTSVLKQRFKLENPHIEIREIVNPLFDSQLVADEIALSLEKMGNLKFKVIAYKKLQEIIRAGALGCEIRITGKLPSDRAKSWRFSEGYLKKAGESMKEVDRSQAVALTKTGIIGIKVAIMNPNARIYDRIVIDDAVKQSIKEVSVEEKKKPKKSKKKETEMHEEHIVKDKDKLEIVRKSNEEVGDAMKIEEDLEDAGESELKTEDSEKSKSKKRVRSK